MLHQKQNPHHAPFEAQAATTLSLTAEIWMSANHLPRQVLMVLLMSMNSPQKLSCRLETIGNSQQKKRKEDKGKMKAVIKAIGKEMVHEEE